MAAPATSSSATRSSGRQKLKLQRLTSLARNARARWNEVDALWALPRLADVGVEMIEQPLPRNDLDGAARLQARSAIPIMLDESIRTTHDMLEAAKKGAGALISLKLMKSGGMVSSRAVAEVALAAGSALYMGTFLESSLGTSGNMQFCATLPHLPLGGELVGPMLIADDINEEPVRYIDGALQLPSGNGIGARIDEDKLEAYRRDRSRTTASVASSNGGDRPMRRAEQGIPRTHRSVRRHRPMCRVEWRLVAGGEVGTVALRRALCRRSRWYPGPCTG
jgi:muconate cycloisomerase/chloromuconate cycloisomerase